MPSGSRIPFPLVQGTDYDRGVRSALAADAQVPLAFAEAPAPVQVSDASASAGAPVPLAVAEAPAFVHGSVSVVSASVQVPSAVAEAPSQVAGVCDHPLYGPPVASSSTAEQAEEEEDDAASVVSSPLVMNKALARLAAFIRDESSKSRPLSAPPLAPRCSFESLFADPPELTRPRFRLYPCVEEIVSDVRDCASTLAKTSKPLSMVLPK